MIALFKAKSSKDTKHILATPEISRQHEREQAVTRNKMEQYEKMWFCSRNATKKQQRSSGLLLRSTETPFHPDGRFKSFISILLQTGNALYFQLVQANA